MSEKSIDINQRIPLDVLQVALEAYLNGTYSYDYILEQLRLEYSGENRLKKALRIVNRVIEKSPLIDIVEARKDEIKIALKKKTDRNVILISLLNAAFPFSFDVLKVFGKFFSVQEEVNSATIKKAISNSYGGNSATENGIYSVVPMFLEANFFSRSKPGVYSWREPLNVSSNISLELYQASFLHNNSIQNLLEYQKMDPYFLFIERF